MKAISIGGVLALLAAGAYGAIGFYGAGKVTRRRRSFPGVPPEAIGSPSESVVFSSRRDGLTLRGWWFPARDARRALILFHGHGQNRVDANWGSDRIARHFLGRGYSVLLFDLRGHGESGDFRFSYGPREQNDVLGALDFVRSKGFPARRVALLGISFGAAALLTAAPLIPNAGAIVADSSYATAWPVIRGQFPRYSKLLARLQPGPAIRFMARLVYDTDLLAARPVDAVMQLSERPILFIHGEADELTPPEHAGQLLAAARHPRSSLWLVPSAAHAETFRTAPDEYLRRVEMFLDEQLAGQDQPATLEPGVHSPNNA